MLLIQTVSGILARILRNKLVILMMLIGASYLLSIHHVFARPPSPGKIPNGNQYYCGTCHESGHVFSDGSPPVPSYPVHGNGMQWPFFNTTPSKTWTADLASQDSDGDGFTNGEELLDPNGTWAIGQPDPGIPIDAANPSDPNSVPPAPQSNGIFVHFDTPAPGKITFDLANLSAPIGLDRVEYTVSQGPTTYFFWTSTSAPYTSGAWDMSQAPKGDYMVSAQLFEKRRASGVTPRSTWVVEGFAINDVHVSSSSYNLNENAGSATVTVQLAASSSQFITVDYATSNGTATASGDYTAKSGGLFFNPGETSKTIEVPIVNDSLDETDETFSLTLSNPSFVQLGAPSSATITIMDDDPQPNVRFSAANHNVNEGAGTATIAVQLSAASSKTVTVAYTTGNGTATEPSDYKSKSGTLTFNPGQTSKTFSVQIVDDNLAEPSETVNLILNNPNNAALGTPPTAILTIADNEASLPIVSISASDAGAAEAGPESGALTVTRDGSTAADLTVHYIVSGSASTSDCNPLSGSVTIPAGQASASITITPVDDTAVEGNETVVVTLEAGADYTVGPLDSATVTIADNDIAVQTVTISASDSDAAEAPLNPGVLTVTRSGSSAAPLTIYYTIGGTATAGSDYTALSDSITIPAGQASATITILPVDDAAAEGNETVILSLRADPSYSIDANGSATVTIADDDTSFAPSWSVYLPLVQR